MLSYLVDSDRVMYKSVRSIIYPFCIGFRDCRLDRKMLSAINRWVSIDLPIENQIDNVRMWGELR